MSKYIALLPYEKIDFIYQDTNFNGICRYRNSICEFKTIKPAMTYAEIFSLTFMEKIKWLFRKWIFLLRT